MSDQVSSQPKPEIVIETDHLAVSHAGRLAVEDMTLRVEQGKICVILGQSGIGKSSIMRCLVGADRPAAGRVLLFGQDLARTRARQLDAIRRRFGCVFQSGGLYSSMTISQNVALAIREHTELDEEVVEIMAQIKLAEVDMQEHAEKMPADLSRDMQKRAAIARALALDPEILFYDDPTIGLDPVIAAAIDKLVVELSRKLAVTSLVVTQNVESAFRIADQVILLRDGKVIADGSTDDLRSSPLPEVRSFIRREARDVGFSYDEGSQGGARPADPGKGTI